MTERADLRPRDPPAARHQEAVLLLRDPPGGGGGRHPCTVGSGRRRARWGRSTAPRWCRRRGRCASATRRPGSSAAWSTRTRSRRTTRTRTPWTSRLTLAALMHAQVGGRGPFHAQDRHRRLEHHRLPAHRLGGDGRLHRGEREADLHPIHLPGGGRRAQGRDQGLRGHLPPGPPGHTADRDSHRPGHAAPRRRCERWRPASARCMRATER